MRGNCKPGHNPSLVKRSLWQTPQACTLMRTWPGPGDGISRSTISKSPCALETCATVIFAILYFASRVRWMCVGLMRNDFAWIQVCVLEPIGGLAACGRAERIRILATRPGDALAGGSPLIFSV